MFSPPILTLLELSGLTEGPAVHEVHRVCVFRRNEARGPRRCRENGPFFGAADCPQTRQESTPPVQQRQSCSGFVQPASECGVLPLSLNHPPPPPPPTSMLCNSRACSRLFSICWMFYDRKKKKKNFSKTILLIIEHGHMSVHEWNWWFSTPLMGYLV